MILLPIIDRLSGLVAWLTDRIAGLCAAAGRAAAARDPAARDPAARDPTARDPTARDPTGADPTGAHPAGAHPANADPTAAAPAATAPAATAPAAAAPARLEPAYIGGVLVRLHHLIARFCAVAATPIPPPKPAPKPTEPRFVPTHTFYTPIFLPAGTPLPPPPQPCSWRWLLRLLPQVAASRAQLQDMLRDPEMVALLAADPRLGPILRPLAWMLGVDRKLLPAARRRPRLVILVPGTVEYVARAVEAYTLARSRNLSMGDIIAIWCRPPEPGRDKRPVWLGPEEDRRVARVSFLAESGGGRRAS